MKIYLLPTVVLSVIIGFYSGIFYSNAPEAPSFSQEHASSLSFSKVEKVFSIIQQSFNDPSVFESMESFENGMIQGLLSGLNDPYSYYLTKKETQDFKQELQGSFEGIGAILEIQDSAITIVTPIKNTPAFEAGIQPKDIILEVNDENVVGKGLQEVVSKIKGPSGTTVTLHIYRSTENKRHTFTLTRSKITIPSVESRVEESLGILTLNQFGDDAKKEVESHLQSLINSNISGLIFDLRNNEGGYLEAAIYISSLFLEGRKEVVHIEKKDTSKTEYTLPTKEKFYTLPMVVLINKGSASASEIVAGALQDHKRAVIIGDTSFGKGSVQEIIPLLDGSAVRVSIAEWKTPLKKSINKQGITPHITLQQAFRSETDYQLNKAKEIILSPDWKTAMDSHTIISSLYDK